MACRECYHTIDDHNTFNGHCCLDSCECDCYINTCKCGHVHNQHWKLTTICCISNCGCGEYREIWN